MAQKKSTPPRTRKRADSRSSFRFEDMRDDPRTLHHWKSIVEGPRTIECQEIRLWGRDFEGAVIAGPGRIQITKELDIRFWVYGTAVQDDGHAFQKVAAAQHNPYDHDHQFRMFATDYQGREWVGGWTKVDYFADTTRAWPMTGELQALSTLATGRWVAPESSVELLLIPPLHLPMGEWSEAVTRLRNEIVHYSQQPGCQIVKAVGTQILFEMDPTEKALWITAKTSNRLTHPEAENWLTEPLRILFGALIYPTIKARNTGDGRAHVTLIPAPLDKRASVVGLMPPFSVGPTRYDEFWKLYAAILTMIVNSPESERPFLEGHQVTRLYQELAQTQGGSRWVFLLSLASTAEALAKSMMGVRDRKSEFSAKALQAMDEHLSAFTGNTDLRNRMISNLANVRQRSVLAFMRQLAARSIVDRTHIETWRRLRNSVMHGELVEPWSSAEGDQHLNEMIGLVHALTHARIKKRRPRSG